MIGLSKITRRIRTRLVEAGFFLVVDHQAAQQAADAEVIFKWSAGRPFTNFGIADDDVFLHACDPEDAVDAASRMAAIILHEYTRAGLSLHLKATKTAVMFSWGGRD